MSHHERTYCTVPFPPAPAVWGAVLESEDTCRRSLDGTEVVLKWEGAQPAELSGATPLSHAEALILMATPAWTDPEPFPPEAP